MAQLPIDEGQDVDVSLPQGRYKGATLVMNARPAEPARKPAEPPRPEQLSETIPAARPAAEGRQDGDEPSIEEYMAALLARTKQYSTTQVREERPYMPPPKASPAQPAVSAPSATPANPASTPASPASAPDCRTAISELRELANISAQSSFNAHRAQRLVLEMRGQRLVAVIAMIASVVLLLLAPSVRSAAYITAVAAVITACAFSLKYLALGRELAILCADANPQGRAGKSSGDAS